MMSSSVSIVMFVLPFFFNDSATAHIFDSAYRRQRQMFIRVWFGKKFGQGTPFNTHWGSMHEGPTPDKIDTSRKSEIGDKISKTMQKRSISEGENNPNYGGISEQHRKNL